MLEFYVDKCGNDSNPGSKELPFATLEAARDAVRCLIATGLKDNVTVHIKEGEYPTKGIRFDKNDSGTDQYSITYCGEGEVVFNGGLTLNPEKFSVLTEEERSRLREDVVDKVICIDLKELGLKETDWGKMCAAGNYNTAAMYDEGVTEPMWCELFFNDSRLTLARYPNEGYLYTLEPVREGESLEHMGKAKMSRSEWTKLRNPLGDICKIDTETMNRVAGWQTLEDVWIFGYPRFNWADTSSPIKRVDANTCELETLYVSKYGIKEHAPYYFYNVLEELDSPGEWYLDRKTGVLYLYPPSKLETANINLSILTENLVRFEDASYITLKNITFTGTRGDALNLSGHHNTVENCVIKNVAGNAAIINGDNFIIRGCHIHHTGKGGVLVSGGDRSTLTSSGNMVMNNHFHHIAQIFLTYQPAILLTGVGCICSNNCIHDSAHMAIHFSGNEHIMEYNEIYDVCQFADDSGAIYTGRDYTTCGNIIRYNYFHDLISGADMNAGIFGIYCDDNAGACTITNNVFLRCHTALLLHGGHDMVFSDNMIIDGVENSKYSLRFHRYAYARDLYNDDFPHPESDHWKHMNEFQRNDSIWAARYPHLAEYTTWDPENEQCYPHYGVITNNLIINHKPMDINFDWTDERFKNRVENNIMITSPEGKS